MQPTWISRSHQRSPSQPLTRQSYASIASCSVTLAPPSTRHQRLSIPPPSTGMFALNSRTARAARLGWSAMCMSTRQRATSPDGPMPRNFASARKLWLSRTGSSDGGLVCSGTSVFVCRSLCTNGTQRARSTVYRSAGAPPYRAYASGRVTAKRQRSSLAS